MRRQKSQSQTHSINLLTHLFLLIFCLVLSTFASGEEKSKKAKETLPQKPEKTVVAKECSQLFKETEKIISEAEQQPGIHKQVQKIKSDYAQSKAELLKLELTLQEKSCQKALKALEKIKQRY